MACRGMTAEDRIAQLEAENAALREQVSELPALRERVALLLARVQELEAQREGQPQQLKAAIQRRA